MMTRDIPRRHRARIEGPAGFALSLYRRRQTRRDEKVSKGERREDVEEETLVLCGRTRERVRGTLGSGTLM